MKEEIRRARADHLRQCTISPFYNPNGSLNAIAGLCNPTGRIFGLMPHPEAYLFPENHPHWQKQRLRGELSVQGLGLQIFQNATNYLRG